MTAKTDTILALDLGTTGNRAIVFDRRQKVHSQIYEEFPQIYPKPGWVEHDPLVIWRSVEKIIHQTLLKIPVQSIAAIGIANQRETVLIWDKKTGRPIHNAIVWQCRRTADICERLKKKGLSDYFHARTGLFIDPYFSGTKIQWLLDHVPGARIRAQKGELLAGTIDSWIIWKLSGGAAHVTDTSNASRTLLFNIRDRRWDEKLCKVLDIPSKILPKVVPSSGISAYTDKRIFGKQMPIAGIIGDQQAAAFAQGCYEPGVIKNTYGTGLFVLENTRSRIKYSKNLISTVAWSLGSLDRTEYAVEGSVFIGGAAIQWLRDGLQILKKTNEAEKIAKSLSSNEGVYFVPALVGLGAPYWDPKARGLVIGITRGTHRSHFVRAAIEAIAYQTRDLLEVMKKDTGAKFKILRADGGASANNFLMQFQSDVLGIPVERPKILETTALGAAGLAGIAVGMWKDRQHFSTLRKVDRVFRPSQNSRSKMEKYYTDWKRVVERSRHWACAIFFVFIFCTVGQAEDNRLTDDDLLKKIQPALTTTSFSSAADPFKNSEPLFAAVVNNRPDEVEKLIKHGAPIELRNENGMSPLDYAVMYNHSGIIAILKEAGAKFSGWPLAVDKVQRNETSLTQTYLYLNDSFATGQISRQDYGRASTYLFLCFSGVLGNIMKAQEKMANLDMQNAIFVKKMAKREEM